jgi:hypothetical protein
MSTLREKLFRCCSTGLLLVICGQSACALDQPDIPTLDAGIGPCRADFSVRNEAGKGIYNVQIDVTIKYGFMQLRNIELDGRTDVAGRSRFTGLPNNPRKPLEFTVKSGAVSTTVIDDPSINCEATLSTILKVH